MCYVLIEGKNWIADINYICDDLEGEVLKLELDETIRKKVDEIIADIRKHPKLVQAVNDGFSKELQLSIDLSPPKPSEESKSLDW